MKLLGTLFSPASFTALALAGLLVAGCGGSSSGRPGLILAKSIFGDGAKPTPSQMEILTSPARSGGEWTSVVVTEDDAVEKNEEWDKEIFVNGGNVFHKCLWFEPVHGEPGILSISANAAHVKIWRKQGGTWTPERLWTGVVGGKENRLRDVEIGDVDGDGQDELVVVTHDHGVTLVFEQTPSGLEPTEVSRSEERIFIHEVEIGDVDGDGVAEFMTTPSEPNKFDGEHQAGRIALFQHEDGGYVESTVEEFTTRHAKEILCTDLDGSGTPELYTALEGTVGQNMEGGGEDTTKIRRYVWDAGQGKLVGEDVMTLPGHLCRFLNAGDTDGDGNLEIVASTRAQGIFSIYNADGAWQKRVVAAPYLTGGFEHATILFDWDGDGTDDIFVASDTQKALQRFYFDPDFNSYEFDEIMSWPDQRYFTWNVMPLPAGQ